MTAGLMWLLTVTTQCKYVLAALSELKSSACWNHLLNVVPFKANERAMYDSDFWVQDSAVTAKCNEWRSPEKAPGSVGTKMA